MTDTNPKPVFQVGDKAPTFELPNQKGQIISSKQLLESGQKILLVFYPSDMTPGCTIQLCGIRDIYQEYRELNVTVLGINHGDQKSHQKFIDMHKYQFDILVDTDKTISREFGQIGSFFGNPTVKRGAILIDESGKIIYIKQGHQDNQEVIKFVKGLSKD